MPLTTQDQELQKLKDMAQRVANTYKEEVILIMDPIGGMEYRSTIPYAVRVSVANKQELENKIEGMVFTPQGER